MKKSIHFIVILLSVLFVSCEEVVDVDLNNTPPKLVIEASINWYKETTGRVQKVKLTTTADYFSNTIPTVSGATVYITNSSNIRFDFIETPNTGEYICNNFVPVINEDYVLTVIEDGETYTATEKLKSVAPISEIIQNNEGGFTGKNIEIKTYFTDPDNESNYYLYKYSYPKEKKINYNADEDIFFQGNKFFSISQNDDLEQGDEIAISHFGISKSYYNYIKILVSIAGGNGGAPFQSPPATVRGNIINTTNAANYPLGYFALSEADTRTYIIQ
ncbi:DUF4249 domain-containing protein [Flavobacterium hiemivividum]|uniref:DUF4249 domain-containing protein n=1 Tax=Flavobacterium hiemivividum TaxID=2541734 RepID=A0A4R5CXB3_9FLAO|nr:DUF4249 domain-containing protein [Flavobacterium hiemivividum]TDE04160.1 DUF4249 domain-containing protein [Flavobacterium hiemivividum]